MTINPIIPKIIDIFIFLNYGVNYGDSISIVLFWCSILELVRTHFAACGGAKKSPRENPERRRSRTNDNFKFFNELSLTHFSKFFNEK